MMNDEEESVDGQYFSSGPKVNFPTSAQEHMAKRFSELRMEKTKPSILDSEHEISSRNRIDDISLDEFMAKVRKSRKKTHKNLWHFPLAKISRDDLISQMHGFKTVALGHKELCAIPPGFVEVVCSVFHYHWNNHEFTNIALETLISVARVGTKEVKIELQQSKILLAVVVTACLQMQNCPFYSPEVDHSLEKLILLCFLEYSGKDGVTTDYHMIEAILGLVCHLLKADHCKEKILRILSLLQSTINRDYDKHSRKVLSKWLSLHGITALVCEYIRNYLLDDSSGEFEVALFIALQIIECTELDKLRSIIPKIIEFLRSKDSNSDIRCKMLKAHYLETAAIALKILDYVVKNPDGARFLFLNSEPLFNSFVEALLNNTNCTIILDSLTDILSKSIQLVVDTTIKESYESSRNKEMCKSMLKNICIQMKPFIINRSSAHTNEWTIYFSYIFYKCASLLHQYFNLDEDDPDDETFLGMIKALAYLYNMEMTVNELNGDGTVSPVWKYLHKRTECLQNFMSFFDTVAYNEEKDSRERKRLEEAVRNDLPDIMNEFMDMHEDISVDFAEAISRIVILFHDDFFAPACASVMYLLLHFNREISINSRNTKKLHASKLLLMWRLCSMDRSRSQVKAIMHLEVLVRETEYCVDELDKKYVARLLDYSKIPIDEAIVDKYFGYLVRDLKLVLNDKDLMDSGILGLPDLEYRWVTYIMANLSRDFKSHSNVMLLKELVFSSLDFIANQNDQLMKKYVDDFIIHLYMKSDSV